MRPNLTICWTTQEVANSFICRIEVHINFYRSSFPFDTAYELVILYDLVLMLVLLRVLMIINNNSKRAKVIGEQEKSDLW